LKIDCFAEDTGLIVPSLGGEPGVFSARYGGPERDPLKNMEKLLAKLNGKNSREAYFETAIALRFGNRLETFVGRCHGHIAKESAGDGGFGYDPIFIPNGYDESFAQLSKSVKNQISHRANAMAKLISFLLDHHSISGVAQ
ncbi:MAG: non-canonical purine NTP pyrophosphatase, partial [Flavobacteriaceae bacterium]|nr:non-canonical purine NTP pyrophosphatase [Flavobacteriaceae bacterium]